ncbi:MAG: hypothetical protein ACJA0V_002169 [Planctomycetota bacterium]|jgi:hypothetical protein
MLRKLLLAMTVAALGAGLSAQCATTSAANNAGTVTLDVDGTAPMAFAFFAVGDTLGTTAINLGSFGTLTLGLAAPFVPAVAGLTDINGDASLSFSVPATAPAGTYYAQGVTIGFGVTPGTGVTLDICAGDVASFIL